MSIDKTKDDPTMAKEVTHSLAEGGTDVDFTYTPEEEGRIKKKIDRYLLPMLAIMYLISYLDRSNMGNAAIIGLKQDLKLTPNQYNLCLTIFFIPFIYTLPTVLRELGHTAEIAQLMTIPIYVAAVVALLTTAYFSDRSGDRSLFVICPLLVGGAGLIGLLAIPKNGVAPGALFAMLFLVAMGLYSIVCGTVAWTANNLAGPWKRSVGMALMIAVGNLGGAVGTNIYLVRESPHYWTGYGTSLGVIVLSLTAATFLRFKYKSINAKRDAMTPDEVREKYSEEELQDMGDDSPFFRYTV